MAALIIIKIKQHFFFWETKIKQHWPLIELIVFKYENTKHCNNLYFLFKSLTIGYQTVLITLIGNIVI